jgi:hypothetical protein
VAGSKDDISKQLTLALSPYCCICHPVFSRACLRITVLRIIGVGLGIIYYNRSTYTRSYRRMLVSEGPDHGATASHGSLPAPHYFRGLVGGRLRSGRCIRE